MKFLFFVCLSLPLLTQAQKKQPLRKFTIDGRVAKPGPVNNFIYLRYEQGGKQKLDSTIISGGRYRFTGQLDYPVKAALYLAMADSTETYYRQTRLLKPYERSFYLDAASIRIDADGELRNAKIKGSPAQADAESLEKQLEVYYRKSDSIYKAQGQTAYQKKDSVAIADYLKKIYRLEDEKDSIRWHFMETHASSGITLDLLQSETGSFLDPARVAPLFSRISPALRASPAGIAYAKRIEKAALTGVGVAGPDFTLNDSTGSAIQFSAFKGKLVLLDFWGSWCFPCRQSNPHLKKMYAAYKHKGFEIVAVSHERGGTLQQQQTKWKKAIQEDELPWVNVMNNDGMHTTDVTKLYDVTAFPTKLLIGSDGRIIRRFVGNTPEKQEELEKLIKQHLEIQENK